jgi:hypothetical protein
MADRILSKESGVAPYETLFHDFDLEAYSFFNYWTTDETTNDTLNLENRDVNEMPRFVKLVWNTAPDLPSQALAKEKLSPSSKLARSSEGPGVPGSRGTYIVDGVSYSPQQLEPSDFSKISTVLANSDISPGVVNSVVTLPLATAGITNATPAYRIDLDTWYSSVSSDGVYVNDVRNAFNNRTDGYFNLTSIYSASISSKNQDAFNELFSGQFTVTPSSFANKKLSISSVNNSSAPALTVEAQAATVKRPSVSSPTADIYGQITYDNDASKSNSVRVNFVDTGIGNAVTSVRVNASSEPSHVNSMVAVGQFVGNLISYAASGLQNVVRKIIMKSFPAPANVSSKKYTGYLIEKYEQLNGVFQLKELIGIGDPDVNEYYDTKVRYGGLYRYRIRSVIRWVRPASLGATGVDPTAQSNLQSNGSYQNISTTSLTPNIVSYLGGEWNNRWAVAQIIDDQSPNPPDQLEVRPQSGKKQIIVTFQLPDNSQFDIFQMNLWRRIVDANGRDIVPWTMISSFDMSRPGYYEDRDVDFIPVVPPGSNYVSPARYVYSVTCTSVHNGESVMSEQIGARLNNEWLQKGEFPAEFFSSRGVDRIRDNGVFSTIPVRVYKTHIIVVPQNTSDSKNPAQVIVTGQERWGKRMLNGNRYILRLHSLDTGETFDVDFSTGLTNLQPQKIQIPSNIYIPSMNEQYVYDTRALTSG